MCVGRNDGQWAVLVKLPVVEQQQTIVFQPIRVVETLHGSLTAPLANTRNDFSSTLQHVADHRCLSI